MGWRAVPFDLLFSIVLVTMKRRKDNGTRTMKLRKITMKRSICSTSMKRSICSAFVNIYPIELLITMEWRSGVLWSIVLITMKWSIYSAFVNICPSKHEYNEIEENNNETEYLFYFYEMEYLQTTKPFWRKDQISIFTQPDQYYSNKKSLASSLPSLDQYYSKRPLASLLPSKGWEEIESSQVRSILPLSSTNSILTTPHSFKPFDTGNY